MKYAIVAVLVAAILGGSIMYSQKMKQDSIEYQKQMEINQENRVRTEEEQEERMNRLFIESCITDAETAYWEYMKLNGTEKEDGSVWALDSYWATGKKDKQAAIDNCYKKYK